jgi:hypothetical protein
MNGSQEGIQCQAIGSPERPLRSTNRGPLMMSRPIDTVDGVVYSLQGRVHVRDRSPLQIQVYAAGLHAVAHPSNGLHICGGLRRRCSPVVMIRVGASPSRSMFS